MAGAAVRSTERTSSLTHGICLGLKMGNESNIYGFNDASAHLAGANNTGSGGDADCSAKDKAIHNWKPDYDMSHPSVQKWHQAAKAHAGDQLTIDCHGTITVHYPDCPEEIARKALIQVDHIAKPTYKQIQDEETKIADLNAGTYKSLDRNGHCYNADYYGDGWVLKVPGAPDNCGPSQPETRRTELPPPPARREQPPHQVGAPPKIEIINEQGGTVNINDCAPCTTGRPSPTWRDYGQTQGGPIQGAPIYEQPPLRGRGWPQPNLGLELVVPGGGYRGWPPNNGWPQNYGWQGQNQGHWYRLPNGHIVPAPQSGYSTWNQPNNGGYLQTPGSQWGPQGNGVWNQQQTGNWIQLPNGTWVQQTPSYNWSPQNNGQHRIPRRWGANVAVNPTAWQSDWTD
jgi:hypothetical protein